jgi:hexosaminidase
MPEKMRYSSTAASLIALSAVLACMSLHAAQTATGTQQTSSPGLALLPQPREITPAATLPLSSGLTIAASSQDPQDLSAAADLHQFLDQRHIPSTSSAVEVQLLRADSSAAQALLQSAALKFDGAMKPEGYALVPTTNGIAVIASSPEGIFYGCQTIKQLISGTGATATLSTAKVRDWPAMQWRGLDDDLSRGPVPTLEFQKQQIRTIAAYKMNLYSPYFEHTFAYASNPLIAPPDGAMTRADVAELVHYAQQFHITIVPEQEAFGHLHNVLTWELYSPLAETSHGQVLAPGQPGSLPLIKQWFTDIDAAFPGPFLHIGADETFELGRGQTSADVDKRGLGAVYIDFLNQVYNTLQPMHKRILFWGDVAMNEPALVKTLPKDLIAVPWTYNPDPAGFDRYILPFKNAGMETWVAPGVNNWNRVYPNNNLALGNIQGFIRDGQRLGSTGALTTVWNDDGEGLFAEDWYGVLFGAAASWQPGESSVPQFDKAYGPAFHGDLTGKIAEAQRELMAAHNVLKGAGLEDASDALFWLDPWSAPGQSTSKKILPVSRDLRLHAERAIILIAEARATNDLRETDALAAIELGARRIDFIGLKFQLADLIVQGYNRALKEQHDPAHRDDVTRELDDITGTNGRCQDLRNTYSLTRALYEKAWLRENRPYWLQNVLVRYDLAIQSWAIRGDKAAAALDQWNQTKTLPPAAELGIPAVVN